MLSLQDIYTVKMLSSADLIFDTHVISVVHTCCWHLNTSGNHLFQNINYQLKNVRVI